MADPLEESDHYDDDRKENQRDERAEGDAAGNKQSSLDDGRQRVKAIGYFFLNSARAVEACSASCSRRSYIFSRE